jgi:hypothetical protein
MFQDKSNNESGENIIYTNLSNSDLSNNTEERAHSNTLIEGAKIARHEKWTKDEVMYIIIFRMKNSQNL